MSLALAVLAEPDPSLRRPTAAALKSAGYEVCEAGSALQLKLRLFSSPLLAADDALLVLDGGIAGQCARELAALIRVRARARSPLPRFILIGAPDAGFEGLERRLVVGSLERPFASWELERLARTGRYQAVG